MEKDLPKALLEQRPEGDLTKTSGTLASGFSGIRIHSKILDFSQGIRSIWHVGAIGDVQSSALGLMAGSAFSSNGECSGTVRNGDLSSFVRKIILLDNNEQYF